MALRWGRVRRGEPKKKQNKTKNKTKEDKPRKKGKKTTKNREID